MGVDCNSSGSDSAGGEGNDHSDVKKGRTRNGNGKTSDTNSELAEGEEKNDVDSKNVALVQIR